MWCYGCKNNKNNAFLPLKWPILGIGANVQSCAKKLRCYSQLDHVTYQFVCRFSASTKEKANLQYTQRIKRDKMTPVGFDMEIEPYPESFLRVESSFKNCFSQGWALDKEVTRKMDPDVTEEDKNDQKIFIKELFDYGLDPNNKKFHLLMQCCK